MFCVKRFLFSKEPAQMLKYAVLNLTTNMFVFIKEETFLVVLVGFELDIANILLIVVEMLCVLHSQMVSVCSNNRVLKVYLS